MSERKACAKFTVIDETGSREIALPEKTFQCVTCGKKEITIFDVYPFNTYCDEHIKPYLSDEPGSGWTTMQQIIARQEIKDGESSEAK